MQKPVGILAILAAAAASAAMTGGRVSPNHRLSVPQLATGLPLIPAFSESHTEEIVRIIRDARDDCGPLPIEYRVDCLRLAMQRAARAVDQSRPDYEDARRILNRAAKGLDQIVRSAADGGAKTIRVQRRKVRPVKPELARSANAAALRVLAETETLLLRSAENSRRRQIHYARIAEAVGSTKVLLRA